MPTRGHEWEKQVIKQVRAPAGTQPGSRAKWLEGVRGNGDLATGSRYVGIVTQNVTPSAAGNLVMRWA